MPGLGTQFLIRFFYYIQFRPALSDNPPMPNECFVIFAANFIRWASHWMAAQAAPVGHALDVRKLGIKRQVQVAAHVSAQVIRDSDGRILRFSEHSAFAGKVLQLPSGGHPPQSRSVFDF